MTTRIEWTDKVWNPTVGCSLVSRGCEHCYAMRQAHRGLSPQHDGLTVMTKHGPRWNGQVNLVQSRLAVPLRWRKPWKVFVDSMSDLFHSEVPFTFIAAVWGVMAAARLHTFIVLTKRPQRLLAFDQWIRSHGDVAPATLIGREAIFHGVDRKLIGKHPRWRYPPDNVIVGVSCEDQPTADERIPPLIECGSAKHRMVSLEPLLGAIDIADWMPGWWCNDCQRVIRGRGRRGAEVDEDTASPVCPFCQSLRVETRYLDWVIVGGESGPGARPCDLPYVDDVVRDCAAAGVPCFVKQLGGRPIASAPPLPGPQSAESIMRHGEYDPDPIEYSFRDKKGADLSEWPEHLRVRQFFRGGTT